MQKPSFDPGLTQQFTGVLRRAINPDGSFNVVRRGTSWRDVHPYLYLINTSWATFLGVVSVAFVVVNTVFAWIYYALPARELVGIDAAAGWGRFVFDFFFSAHTLTTVGYGNLAPVGVTANFVAAFESMVGLMGFALATGLLFGRVSRPSARIGFSDKMLLSPYQDRTSLQFRVVNQRSNTIVELKAMVLLMTVEGEPGKLTRQFKNLTLERDSVLFLPLTWTVVHPIDESSPFFGKTPQELEKLQAEVLIMIKGFDETFSQTVNTRFSYRHDEIVWGAKFSPAFHIDDDGEIVLEVNQVGKYLSASA